MPPAIFTASVYRFDTKAGPIARIAHRGPTMDLVLQPPHKALGLLCDARPLALARVPSGNFYSRESRTITSLAPSLLFVIDAEARGFTRRLSLEAPIPRAPGAFLLAAIIG